MVLKIFYNVENVILVNTPCIIDSEVPRWKVKKVSLSSCQRQRRKDHRTNSHRLGTNGRKRIRRYHQRFTCPLTRPYPPPVSSLCSRVSQGPRSWHTEPRNPLPSRDHVDVDTHLHLFGRSGTRIGAQVKERSTHCNPMERRDSCLPHTTYPGSIRCSKLPTRKREVSLFTIWQKESFASVWTLSTTGDSWQTEGVRSRT